MENKLIKTLSHKISITEILRFEEKENVKTMSKRAIYQYILTFAGWQSIFWVLVSVGGCIVAGGGWWWAVMVIFWLVEVDGGEYILAGGGWW